MNTKAALLELIRNKYKYLTPSQQILADFILSNIEQVAFLNAKKLADKVGVSEATIYRFATTLGYNGFPDLHNDLQKIIKEKLNTVRRLSDSQLNKNSTYQRVIERDLVNMEAMLQNTENLLVFNNVVEMIFKAPKVWLVANRSAYFIASFFAFYLKLIGKKLGIIREGCFSIGEQLLDVDDDDVAIGLSFFRYSRHTVETMELLNEKGIRTVAITDNISAPIAQCCNLLMIANSDIGSFVESGAAPVSLLCAIVTAVGQKGKEKVLERLQLIEEINESNNVFYP